VLMLSLIVIPLCLLLWLRAFTRLGQGRPILAWQPRRPVPWSAGELLLCALAGVLLVMATQSVAAWIVPMPEGRWTLDDLSPGQQVAMVLAFSVSSLLTMAASAALLRRVAGATWDDLGWVRSRWLEDVLLGAGAYAMLVVPMLVLHYFAQRLTNLTEPHPFVELLSDDPDFGYLLPISVAALLAAPLAEEFFFRLLLQGWLERLMTRWECESQVAQGAMVTPAGDVTEGDGERRLPGNAPPGRRARWVPICVSALVFALAHIGQGAAPLALFFLALGLGYLYQRTHRLLPSIITHFLINFTAVLQLWEFLVFQRA